MLLATGSEVGLAVQAYEQLTAEGVKARVVSMPSWELFEQQSEEYQNQVLPPDSHGPRLHRAVGDVRLGEVRRPERHSVGMRTFGASAPLQELQKKFGFTVDAVVDAAKEQLAKNR